MPRSVHESSFRDPSGFIFSEGDRLLRQVNECYQAEYRHLMDSGLYQRLTGEGLLVPHREVEGHAGTTGDAFLVIEPERIPFISYPYEWSFNQLKDAALVTLRIQQAALECGMTLKDASAYNIQFFKGRPVFIDTLSFDLYHEGKPWEAYRQYCQHFLAPLALMSHTDIRLNQLLKIYLDGIPLDLASRLLPRKTKWNFALLMHLHLHAKTQVKYEHKGSAGREVKIPLANLKALIGSLIRLTQRLNMKKQRTEWGAYYTFTNYTDDSFTRKKEIIDRFVRSIGPATLWDLGANNGEFTRIAARQGVDCVAFDIDPIAVDIDYLDVRSTGIPNLLPLVMDLTNPSPSIGWNNRERPGFTARTLPDTVIALALIHHLAISNNLPFSHIATFLHGVCTNLIIEFVPKSDSQVQKLLESRKDIFGTYEEETFRREFSRFFEILEAEKVSGSERTIYRMKRRIPGDAGPESAGI